MVSEDGIGLRKVDSSRIMIEVRIFVTKPATMKYSRASAGRNLEMKIERQKVGERQGELGTDPYRPRQIALGSCIVVATSLPIGDTLGS